MVDRREFMAAAGIAALGAPLAAAASAGYGEEAYRRAIVIDSLGGPGGRAPSGGDDAHWSDAEIEDVRVSGLTACNLTVSLVGNAPGRYAATLENIAHTDGEIARHPDVFLKVLKAADLATAKSSNRLGVIYGFQDTSMLEGDLSRLEVFTGLGVRIVQMTYNRGNLMGDGCLEARDAGLTRLGRELIERLNQRRVLLDLSHGGARTIEEGIAACKGPLAITHTGCRALVDVPRNVRDEALKAVADKGGVVGIYSMCFLKYLSQPHREDLIRHVEHAVEVCGEDHVGLGTDGNISALTVDEAYRKSFRAEIAERIKAGISAPGESPDVLNMIPEYNTPRRFLLLADDLGRRGWPESRIEKLLGANFARLFTEVWG
jgi:membrane dipeptidase